MKYRVHGFLDDVKILDQPMNVLPRNGDTMRFSRERYGKVSEIVWCMDEPDDNGQRVNIRIVSL